MSHSNQRVDLKYLYNSYNNKKHNKNEEQVPVYTGLN